MNVGFYYMANTAGRLTGTVLSGALYQWGLQSGPSNGLIACLWASSAFVLVAGLLSLLLPRHLGPRSKPIKLGDLGELRGEFVLAALNKRAEPALPSAGLLAIAGATPAMA